MQKKLYIGTNTKMFKTAAQNESFLIRLDVLTKQIQEKNIELFVIPSYTSLDRGKRVLEARVSKIRLGAQNMGWEETGQFTGEISPLMLQECGVDLVMIGHSERRQVFGENNWQEEKKVRCGLDHGMTVLLCVGEQKEDKLYKINDEIIRVQLKIALHGVLPQEAEKLWIAYEPSWAIGTEGVPAEPDYVNQRHKVIRETLLDLLGEAGRTIPILYGGSVNPQNALNLICCEYVDGLFVGRSAWDADRFSEMISSVVEHINW